MIIIIVIINNGNRTECSPIRPVIIWVIKKSEDRKVRDLLNHEYETCTDRYRMT